ncbi:MAG TPA: hypothetical protein VLC30_06020 [Pseudomonas sp.]|nr:hypothetical protein [Pseudomonas sp.]
MDDALLVHRGVAGGWVKRHPPYEHAILGACDDTCPGMQDAWF